MGMAECNQKKVMRTALRSLQRTSGSAHTRGGSLEGTPTDRCTPGAVSAAARPLGAGSGDAGVWSCSGEARPPVMSAAMWPKKPALHLSCVGELAHGGSCSSSAACVCGKPARTQQFWGRRASRPTDARKQLVIASSNESQPYALHCSGEIAKECYWPPVPGLLSRPRSEMGALFSAGACAAQLSGFAAAALSDMTTCVPCSSNSIA